jgi:hypothetical protein
MQVNCDFNVKKVKAPGGFRLRVDLEIQQSYRPAAKTRRQSAYFKTQSAFWTRVEMAHLSSQAVAELRLAATSAFLTADKNETVRAVALDADQMQLLGFNLLATLWRDSVDPSLASHA